MDFRKAEIVGEYSNAWIDMRHDNALNSAEPGMLVERPGACLTGLLGRGPLSPVGIYGVGEASRLSSGCDWFSPYLFAYLPELA